jgi:hypothetical protein
MMIDNQFIGPAPIGHDQSGNPDEADRNDPEMSKFFVVGENDEGERPGEPG